MLDDTSWTSPIVSSAASLAQTSVQLVVKYESTCGTDVRYKICKSTPLIRLMDVHCNQLGLQALHVRFMVYVEIIAPNDTPEVLGLESENPIDVVVDKLPA